MFFMYGCAPEDIQSHIDRTPQGNVVLSQELAMQIDQAMLEYNRTCSILTLLNVTSMEKIFMLAIQHGERLDDDLWVEVNYPQMALQIGCDGNDVWIMVCELSNKRLIDIVWGDALVSDDILVRVNFLTHPEFSPTPFLM